MRAALLSILCVACYGQPRLTIVPCEPEQAWPYPSGLPYVGIHANAANDDVVRCETNDQFQPVWQTLDGHAVMQPATLSPDGERVYVTVTTPLEGDCTLYALGATDGAPRWCAALPFDVVASSVEVDEDGNLFVSAGGRAISFDPNGGTRWDQPLWPASRPEDVSPYTGYGVHFTGDGHVATITANGRVVLLDRGTGEILASLDTVEAFGLIPPADTPLSGFDLIPFMPDEVVEDVETIFGDRAGAALGSFFGAGSNVSDNTIAISPRGEFYAMTSGPESDTGALIQVLVEPGPTLTPGWLAVTRPGSAATPSVTPDGRWVASSDGTATRDLMDPENADATVFAVDVDACNANTDSDPEPARCGVSWEHALERGAMPGAPALLADGTVWFYELGFSLNSDPQARDLVRVGPDGVLVERTLPDGLEWNSVLTVTDNHIIGTASVIVPSDETLAGLTLPCLLYTSPSPRDQRGSRMPSSA